ncbi:MAG TPA: uroporphyrinogen-III C-methyltransferase [Acidimicrobiales bacterium]|nr:uroporphyrinogen-III C-methyltransferase [Acidimicrobiales bacterium]
MTVYLVGAGPGDPGLMTARGSELLARADAVVHDRLVHPRLLEIVPAGAEVHDVGKRPGEPGGQEDIDSLLVHLGQLHESGTVVRLKGGDPFVFGRGGEEAQALRAAGLAYEVVPGVSAVNGALAYAGIPLTHRGVAGGFTVVTGHGAAGSGAPVDWDALAHVGGTIVVLMGARRRAEIAERLVAGGLPASTPVAVVENGSLAGQRVMRTTLGGLASLEVGAPATIVVGGVAALDLSWFDRPLAGWTVAVTRARQQAGVLSAALGEAGAETIEIPTIALVEPDDGGEALGGALGRLASFDWVVFTSAATVDRAFGRLRDARSFGAARVACIGKGTAAELARHGVVADLVPEAFDSQALAEAFPPAGDGQRVLMPRAAVAGDVLPDELRAKGYQVEIVEAYKVARPEPDAAWAAAARRADAVIFASASAAVGWVEAVGLESTPPVVCCIGPVTVAAARAHGLDVTVEATDRSVAGLVQALVDYARTHGRPG